MALGKITPVVNANTTFRSSQSSAGSTRTQNSSRPSTSRPRNNAVFQHSIRTQNSSRPSSLIRPQDVIVEQPRSESVSTTTDNGPLPDYRIVSILVCFCCCWFVGVIAVYFSFKAKYLESKGKLEKARSKSGDALKLIQVTGGLGFICFIVILVALRIAAVILV